MSLPTPPQIVIFGGSGYRRRDPVYHDAEALGAALARQGWTVVNGGYGGTMRASARGANGEGGHVVGVTCSIFRGRPNPYIHEVVTTDDLTARLQKLIDLGDAYIALPGSTGTLAELAMVWELMNKGLIPRRPLLCWGEFWRPVVEVFDHDETTDARLPNAPRVQRRGALIEFVHSPEEAVAVLGRAFGPKA